MGEAKSKCITVPEGKLPYETDGDARRKFTPKGDHLGVAQAFCDP